MNVNTDLHSMLPQQGYWRAQQTHTATAIMNPDEVSDNIVQEHHCGLMTSPCGYCSTNRLTNESTRQGDVFTLCCSKGKVKLPRLFAIPAWLQQLYQGGDGKCHNFWDNIRNYNSALAFASMGAHISSPGNGPHCFKIHSQIYHHSGPLHLSHVHEQP